MSSSHVYFLIDGSAINYSQRAVGAVLVQILVYLSAQHQRISWNYELVDLESRPEPITAQHKRKVRERREISVASVDKFLAELRELPTGRQSAHSCAPIETLHARLMCLEADVEWGDPATMRSPVRNSQARAWTDPTRINESMSVQKYLFIVGRAPESLATLRDFVRGPAMNTEPQEDGSLIEQLTELRDGVIGKGLWESYARKRVGISFVSVAHRRAVADMDPVDILINGVFESCFESLGGCVVPLNCLLVRGLPFSSLFSPWHRRRTYPSWSRKFAREVSAVLDRFSEDGGEESYREWLLAMGNMPNAVRLRQLPIPKQRWLTDGRLHRRYDLAEMVAIASDYRQACAESQQGHDGGSMLVAIGTAPMDLWLRIVREVGTAPPIYCDVERAQLSSRSIIIARSTAPAAPERGSSRVLFQQAAPAQVQTLVLVVPVSEGGAAIYYIDDGVYARISGIISEYGDQDHTYPSDHPFRQFEPSWIESWSWKDAVCHVSVQPQDKCSIDVGLCSLQIDCSLFEPETSSSIRSSPLHMDGQTGSEVTAVQIWEPVDVTDADECISSLELWYSNVYLKTVADTCLTFDRVLDTLESLCLSDSDSSTSMMDQLAHDILLTSADIDDFFEEDKMDGAGNVFQQMRVKMAKELTDDSVQQQCSWRLQECRVQILLHLFVLDYARSHSKELVNGHTCENLLESLHDLVDLLCIWASLDDIAITPISRTTSTTGDPSRSDSQSSPVIDTPSDLAGAFISSPCMAQFDDSLCDVLEELRIQCGWVPSERIDVAQNATVVMSPDSKRRKGTPRRLQSGQSLPKSEVIVLQRQNKPQTSVSGRRLARHLDELISNKKLKLEEPVPSEPKQGSVPSMLERQPSSRKLPSHLVRKIKSEVVSTTHGTLAARQNDNAPIRRKY
ncbi:hypothetical protein FBU59_001519 [Linderina macrospora]|uniref:Uncharacterized protein n=1 Tax=Linderina macrospora TaxID=4868 RepID=A0ACC1JE24_9FUNG|nr:hypothetical protein FBU59_001519 [Linderina macrospora]